MSLSQIAYTGLHATQMALSSTAQNVANANTPGFSRVSTLMGSLSGQPGLNAGGGVQVSSIRRMTSDFQNQQLWRANTEMQFHHSAQQYLGALEGLMSGDGSSISIGLDQFFASLSELTVSPESVALRQQVLSEANNLAQRFNGLSGNIHAQMQGLHEQRQAMVVEANGLISNLAELNRQVVATESVGGDSKALRDHRENLVKDLSEFASLRIHEVADGSLTVSLANGQPLVAGTTAATLKVNALPSGEQELALSFATANFPLTQDKLGGSLGGLYQVEYGSLRPVLDELHGMAEELASGLNGLLAGGFDLQGQPGQPLFTYDPSSISSMLQTNDLTASQLGLSGVAGEVGNNDVLQALLEFRNTPITLNGNQVTLNDAYAGMLGRVASDSRQNQADLHSATVVREQAQAQRDSISAVNLDEEAVNLMNYIQAYQANMQVVTSANQLFEELLSAFR